MFRSRCSALSIAVSRGRTRMAGEFTSQTMQHFCAEQLSGVLGLMRSGLIGLSFTQRSARGAKTGSSGAIFRTIHMPYLSSVRNRKRPDVKSMSGDIPTQINSTGKTVNGQKPEPGSFCHQPESTKISTTGTSRAWANWNCIESKVFGR